MKIAITAKGDTLDAAVDPRFGRAAKFIVYDLENESVEVIDNSQNLNAASGAGIQSGQNVSGLGVDVVITGHCGPKAFRTLEAAGITVILGAQGTVAETLEHFRNGTLTATDQPDVASHWA